MQFAVKLDRVIAAPRAKVYRAWLDPNVLAKWMGPDGHTVTWATVDERVGGKHEVEMVGPEGSHHAFTSVIEELVPDERIALRFRFDVSGDESLLRITLRDSATGGTALRLEHERITLAPPLDEGSVDIGWTQTLAKLTVLLEHN